MTNPVILDSNNHKNVLVKQDAIASGFALRNTTVVLREFQHLVLDYPILLTKNRETGAFTCVSLFGFDEGENLFVEGGRWNAVYVPLNVRRGPFMVGSQEASTDKQADNAFVLLDMDSPLVQDDTGEPLFNERGFPTPYLETMTSVLKALKDGYVETSMFIEKLLSLDLIAPVTLKIKFVNQEEREIKGLYTVDQNKVNALSEAVVAELHTLGYLAPIYTMIASFGQIQSLIEKKNRALSSS